MRSKRVFVLLLSAILVVGLIGFAGDEQRDRTPAPQPPIERVSVQAQAEPGTGEQVQPVFEPGIAQINGSYQPRVDALIAELDAATTEDAREEVQQRVMRLKLEWSLAVMGRHIEIARENGDAQLEAELSVSKERMENPPTVTRVEVPRDPNAGIEREGGAR